MRLSAILVLTSLSLVLASCAGVIDNCPNGLGPPPGCSAIPASHGAAP
ncbi:MAG TPA: hypothetical protein VGI79_04000 [Caulobacteraceae bacterium]|jgi:hypothetical protein